LGEIATCQGDFAGARALYEESLAIQRQMAEKHNIARTLTLLGDTAFAQGDHAYARACYAESLQLYQGLASAPDVAQMLERVALLAAADGRLDRAARLLGASESFLSAEHSQLPPAIREQHARDVAAMRATLDHVRLAPARTEGRA